MTWTLLTLFCCLFVWNGILLSSEKRPMTFVDVINIKNRSGLRISPDGTQVLYTQSDADWEENRRISHIWRLNMDKNEVVQMTNGLKGEGGGLWSPDGKTISFITLREGDNNDEDDHYDQIFLLNNSGGEAIQLTDHDSDIRTHRWSPCGSRIYFLAQDPLTEEEEEKKEDKDDAFIFEQDYNLTHLWVFDLETKKEKRLTEGDFTIREFSISRDGTKIVHTAAPTPSYDDTLNSEVWLLDLESGERKQITQNGIYEFDVSLSPDSSQILFVAESNADQTDYYFQQNAFVVPVEGGKPKALIPDFEYEVMDTDWSSDGKTVYFTANMGVHAEIFSFTLKGPKLKQLTDGRHAIYGFDHNPKNDTLLYEMNSPQNPETFWLLDIKSSKAHMIHDPHPELDAFQLAEYESVRWKSTDGMEVEGILVYPVEYEKGKRYPLLAHTHGGPMGSDKFTFDGYAHVRAGRGYAVFKPNYRGSTGYGNEVLRDMVGHYFLHADDDVITGVEFLVERGIADPRDSERSDGAQAGT